MLSSAIDEKTKKISQLIKKKKEELLEHVNI